MSAVPKDSGEPFELVVWPGVTRVYGRPAEVFCKIKWDGVRLSITGVEGPLRNGNAIGGCGQLSDLTIDEYAQGWGADLLARFLAAWRAWHLNDMRPGCEHQRAQKWDERPIDPSKPTCSYGKHFAGQRSDSWNMLAWVNREEHPDGLLSYPCPVCGYKYGSSWLREEVPSDVLDFLRNLPPAGRTPAWV